MHRELERLEGELQDIKKRCEDLRASKQEVVRELLQLQDLHQDQVRMIQLDLQDEASSREGMDRRLADLRSEVINCSFLSKIFLRQRPIHTRHMCSKEISIFLLSLNIILSKKPIQLNINTSVII